jgi:hypothetical protein
VIERFRKRPGGEAFGVRGWASTSDDESFTVADMLDLPWREQVVVNTLLTLYTLGRASNAIAIVRVEALLAPRSRQSPRSR